MCSGRSLLRTYYYTCPTFVSQVPTQEERELQINQSRFFTKIQSLPQFECRFGRLAKHLDGTLNKNVWT